MLGFNTTKGNSKLVIIVPLCVVYRRCDHGHRGGAHRPDQGAAPAGAVLLLGHAGVGLLHRRYACWSERFSCWDTRITDRHSAADCATSCFHISPPSAGFALVWQVSVHTFGLVQSKLFPVYFYCLLGSNCVSLAVYAVYHPRELLDWHESVQVRGPAGKALCLPEPVDLSETMLLLFCR